MMDANHPAHPGKLFPESYLLVPQPPGYEEVEYEFCHETWKSAHEALLASGWVEHDREIEIERDRGDCFWEGMATYRHPETRTEFQFCVSACVCMSEDGFSLDGGTFGCFGGASVGEYSE